MTELKPSFTQCGCTTAQEDRQLTSSLVCLEGVAPATSGEPLEVTAGSGMVLNVAAGNAFVQGDTVAWQGMYHVSNDASKTVTIPTADPTNPRIDLIVAHVKDSTYVGAVCNWAIEAVTGTPLPSPSAPAVPDSALVLAQVSVPANDTTIDAGQITDMRQFYVECAAAPVGAIQMHAGTGTLPNGWLVCNGAAVSRARWARLFAAIGTAYGTGDGSTTFNLPDFASKFARGNTPGTTGGAATHTHDLSSNGWAEITMEAISAPNIFIRRITIPTWTANLSAGAGSGPSASSASKSTATQLGGSTDTGDSLPPYVGVRFIIKA